MYMYLLQLQKEFENILKFWLRQGVDGFIMRDMDRMFVYRHSDLLPAVKAWRSILNDHRSPQTVASSTITGRCKL